MMRPKVLNRSGTFIGPKGLTGVAEISFAPFVLNRHARRRTDFDEFKQPSARQEAEAQSGDS
jgi:hypothetical protein